MQCFLLLNAAYATCAATLSSSIAEGALSWVDMSSFVGLKALQEARQTVDKQLMS